MKKRRKPLILLMFPALFLASPARFERAAFRLGVDPISHREVTPDAKKCLEILGFSPFPIPSDTML